MTTDKETTHTSTAMANLNEKCPIRSLQEAREYLDAWHRENFPTDRTFSRYILGTQGDRSGLAGDFAWQLANALARRAAQPVALSQVLRDTAMGGIPESVARLLMDAACAIEPYEIANPSLQVAEGAELPPIIDLDSTRARNFPICVTGHDGKSAYVEIVGGVLVHGGDLPTDEAARVFLEALATSTIAASRRAATEKEARALDALDGMGFTYDREIGWLPPAAQPAEVSAGQAGQVAK